VYLLYIGAGTDLHVIVMEDLAPRLRIPAHPHQWTGAEIRSVLRAYAQLHTTQFETLDYSWLVPRHESLVDLEKIPEQAAILQRAGIWDDLPRLHDLIARARESCAKYANENPSLIHGDTTPANTALPPDLNLRQAATLIDWQDAGVGMPEFDLAYMDLQPFDSARFIPRPELLELYWLYRAEIDPAIPSPKERRLRQLHADLLTTLWLTASASRVTLHPFPTGSYQQIHWASQYGIVYNRLQSLSEKISVS
jgi:aminoglycoside phosphotransferase (APT) family kinase protein